MQAIDFFKYIRNGLIVSCQAEGNDPFNTPEGVALFAKAAEMGGAKAIRSCGLEKTAKIIEKVDIPVIGLTKAEFNDGTIRITRSARDVEKLFDMGCTMVAVDGTARFWDGLTGPEFISKMKQKTGKLIMADIASYDEAIDCIKAGADCISTTLNGYTPETKGDDNEKPNIALIERISKNVKVPLFAEGRISSPEDARSALNAGAYAVVVGTAVTRPRVMTARYAEALKG